MNKRLIIVITVIFTFIWAALTGPASAAFSGQPGPYTQRGDWEPPDLLLIVESEEWQDSVDLILKAANKDMTPVYLLINKDDGLSTDYFDSTTVEERDRDFFPLKLSLDTPWIRDYGPLQLKSIDGSVKWMDFDYSTDRFYDDSVPSQLAGYIGAFVEHYDLVLDGGAIISNGRGLCAITDESLEEASIDPLYPEELEGFRNLLGCKALAVLPALTGESTGHADIIAQFLSPETVAVALVDQKAEKVIAGELEQTVKSLKMTADEIGQPLKVIRLPLIVKDGGFYSYINGTRLKNTYLIPSFKKIPPATEHLAINTLRSALPNITVFLIPADSIVKKGGAVHCITLGLNVPGESGTFQYWVKRNLRHLSSGQVLFN